MKERIVRVENERFSKTFIPQYTERVDKAKGWINYGDDNLFPQYLSSLINKSPIHSSILKKKAMLIGGRGFMLQNLQPETIEFIKNRRNECDLEEILAKVSYDFEMYGAFALNIIWSKDRTRISEINYIDPSTIRIAECDPKNPNITQYFISEGFENTRKYQPVLYPEFSTTNKKKASQILYVKDHRAGSDYYGQPEYLSAIFWIELQIQISQYHLNNINNSFHPSFFIHWPVGNNASDEELESLVERLKSQFSGAVNAGDVVISLEDKENAPTLTPIEANTSDERYVILQDMVERNILQAHRVNNPEIFGIMTEGKNIIKWGSSERIESIQEFQIDYVIPKQRIIEKWFNKLAYINGIEDKLIINQYTDQFKKIGTSTAEVLSILTAGISSEQKYELLIANNYTRDLATKLSGFNPAQKINETND